MVRIHQNPRVALAKALLAASLRPPLPGPDGALVLLSLADRDKPRLPELAAALAAAGDRFAATHGTAAALRAQGRAVREVGGWTRGWSRPRHAGRDHLGRGALCVNTPLPEPAVVSDAARIRQTTVAEGILCFTTIEAARSLDPVVVAACSDVRPLGEWQGMTGPSRSPSRPARVSPRGVALCDDSDRQACRDMG